MSTNKLIDKVIAKVHEREAELFGSYGLNIEQIIYSAMEQYRDVINEYESDMPVRLKSLTWALGQYVNETSRRSYSYEERSEGQILTERELRSDDLDTTKLRISPYNAHNFKCNKHYN